MGRLISIVLWGFVSLTALAFLGEGLWAAPSWVNPKYQNALLEKALSPNQELPKPPAPSDVQDWSAGTDVVRIQDGIIYFTAPSGEKFPPPLKTKIHKGEYIGKLFPKDGKHPYLILSGFPCANCDGRKFLYVIRSDGSSYEKMLFPGKVRDARSNRLLHESRAFYGRCLAGRGDVYVSLQKEKIRRRKYLQPATFIAEARGSLLEKETIVRWRRAQRLRRQVLRSVRRKDCQEIKGYTRKTMNIKAQREQEASPSTPLPVSLDKEG